MASGIGEKRGTEYVGLDLSGSEKKQKWEEYLADCKRGEETHETDYSDRRMIFGTNDQTNYCTVDYFETENEMDDYEIDGAAERQKTCDRAFYEEEAELREAAALVAYCEKKIYEMEKQVFFKWINRESEEDSDEMADDEATVNRGREEASHEMTDDEEAINKGREEASHEMTEDEARKFETKGWFLDSHRVGVMCTDDWYYYLRLNDKDYGRVVYVSNTYEGDLKYDEFYKALSGEIHKGMTLDEIEEVGMQMRIDRFPVLDDLAAWAACVDHFQAFEREERMEERIRLLSKLWTQVESQKRDFAEVMKELYADIGSYNEEIRRAITQFFDRDYMRLKIVFWFDEFSRYVTTHNANQTCKDIGKTAKAFCWDHDISDNVFNDPEPTTYDMYRKEKLRIASSLGRNSP